MEPGLLRAIVTEIDRSSHGRPLMDNHSASGPASSMADQAAWLAALAVTGWASWRAWPTPTSPSMTAGSWASSRGSWPA